MSNSSRRRLLVSLSVATLAAALPMTGAATNFPQQGKPIRIIVGFTAGGGTDAQARIVAQKLSELLGSSVVVENKPGASTMLAASEVARAPADGYTLLYAPSSTMAQNPHTFAQVPYDPFKDFTPISMGGRGPLVLSVSTSVPANNVPDLIKYIKSNNNISYASFGAGTSSHIYGEAFLNKTGTQAVHIPYKGGSDAAKDLIGGRVHYMFDSASSAIITSSTGKVKILAVAASERIPALPDVPTFKEQGFDGLDLPSWLGFYGPAGIPKDIVEKLNQSIKTVLDKQEVKEFYRNGGYEAGETSSEEFGKITRQTYEQWGAMVQQVGLKKQ